MTTPRTKANISKWHKWMGLILSVPLLAWVISSAVLIYTTFDMPNGLAGVYQLNPYNSQSLPLTQAKLQPSDILRKLQSDYGIKHIQWLRLESRGKHLWYVVRPTPFSLAMTFDAYSGQRLDPMSDELLAIAANESLVGTRVSGMIDQPEFNRDYAVDRVPAVAVKMVGEQPSILMLSRDNGRTLRRLGNDAERFNWWYKYFHVNQLTDHVIPWTTLLYLCVLGVLVVIVMGYMLFWWRRFRFVQSSTAKQPWYGSRNLHRKFGILTGGVLVVQLIAGVYIWLSLGPLNPAFRGKDSFAENWQDGMSTQGELASVEQVIAATIEQLPDSPYPLQAITWQHLGAHHTWSVTVRKDELPVLFNADTKERMPALSSEFAGEITRQQMAGQPTFDYVESKDFSSMDLAQKLPAYRFRFHDAQQTDVYVLQQTGEIVMRRPFFWRIFGPFLNVHMLAFTKNKVFDVLILACFQVSFLIVILSGWRLQFPRKRPYEKTTLSS